MPTIFDVAHAAGVSHQTVSRVLNGDGSVRAETRAKVEAQITRLAYRPSAAARALARRKSRTIGLITVGMPLYGPASITHGFNEAARRAGWDVSIAALDETVDGDVRHAADALLGQDVQAIVVVTPSPRVGEALAPFVGQVPIVTTVADGVAGASAVVIDEERAAAAAVEHLAALGHRSVLHVAGPEDWSEAAQRLGGWQEASERLGLVTDPVLRGDWTSADGYRIGTEIAAAGAPTAVFCANDQMALGLLAAFGEAGVRVPEDVSLVGFDDIPEARFFGPPLTTLRQDFTALGRRLMVRVEDLLSGDPLREPEPVVPDLIVRASTAPPR